MRNLTEYIVTAQYELQLAHFPTMAATEAEAIEQIKAQCIADGVGFEVDAYSWYSKSTFEDRAWWSLLYAGPQKSSLVQDLHRAGIITDWQVWEVLSSFHSPFSSSEAVQVYRAMGLEPFAGYPLVRS